MKLLKLAALLSLAVSTLTLSVGVASAGEVVWWTPNWGEARAKELADKFMAANPGITIRMEVTVSERPARARADRALVRRAARHHRGAARLGERLRAGRPHRAARRRDPGARGLHPRRARLRHLGRQALGHPLPHRDARASSSTRISGRRPGSTPTSRRRPGTSSSPRRRSSPRPASRASPSPAAAKSATPSSARCPSSG